MIFVTIGTLFPFDRLISAADEIAPTLPGHVFVAQIGNGKYKPANMEYATVLPVKAYAEKIQQSDIVVAHAGMGSVITALAAEKPIVVLPRLAAAGEMTTDHQLHGAKWLARKPGVYVAWDETELRASLVDALAGKNAGDGIGPFAQPQLISQLRAFMSA